MSIQSDRWIREQSQKGMIAPFSEKQVREGVISYGPAASPRIKIVNEPALP